MRKVDKKTNESTSVDRSNYVQIQTPQVFQLNKLVKIFNKVDGINYSDESSLIETEGIKINLVLGEEQNIKITTKRDLRFFLKN